MRTNGEMPIRVLLADDSDIMREAIKKLLAEEPRIHIVGEALYLRSRPADDRRFQA